MRSIGKFSKHIFWVAALCLTVFVLNSMPAAAEVIVIANKDVTTGSIDRASLSDIFLGKKTLWDKNSKIVLSVLKNGAIHDQFLNIYIGKTSAQFQSYWNKILFTGAGTPPTAFKTEKELVDFVAKTKGAIGYIDSTTGHDNVKVLRVQ